ncbi:hypothetical protein Tco_1376284 [Tanacetum coccineum]
MSKSVKQAPTPVDSVVRNTAGKGSKRPTDGPMPDEELREFCDKHYNQLLPLMAEKVHQEKLQVVQTCLTYEESSRRNSQAKEKTHVSESESCDKKKRSKKRRKPSLSTTSRRSYPSQSPSVFSRMKHGEQSSPRQGSPSTTVFTRLGTRMQDERQVLEELKETQTAEKRSGEPRAKLYSGQDRMMGHARLVPHVQFYADRDPVEIHHIKKKREIQLKPSWNASKLRACTSAELHNA